MSGICLIEETLNNQLMNGFVYYFYFQSNKNEIPAYLTIFIAIAFFLNWVYVA